MSGYAGDKGAWHVTSLWFFAGVRANGYGGCRLWRSGGGASLAEEGGPELGAGAAVPDLECVR